MKKWPFVALLIVGATVLGATVLREPIAWAAQAVDARIVGPLDADGNVSVHEQGTANVNVTNSSVPVTGEDDVVARQHQDCRTVFIPAGQAGGNAVFDAIPEGKRFVVKYASIQIHLPIGQRPSARIGLFFLDGSSINGMSFHIPLMFQNQLAALDDVYVGSEVVLGYQDSNVPAPRLEVFRDDTAGTAGVSSACISGYLIDLP